MALATPVSSKFHIGSPEIRIGAMTLANKLTQSHSLGLLQGANVKFTQESVDLKGGLPKTLVDTAIIETSVTVEAQAYEYSRKNIRVMINEGIESTPATEYAGLATATTAVSGSGTSVIDTDILLTDVNVGDMVVIYQPALPEKLSVVKVTAKAAVNTDKARITIDNTKTPLLFAVNIGDVVFKANQIGLGNSTATNYFAVDVVGLEHATGRPVGFRFWKAAFSGGLDYSFSNDNYAVTPISLKVLQPSAADYTTGPLAHLAEIIPTHPFGLYFAG